MHSLEYLSDFSGVSLIFCIPNPIQEIKIISPLVFILHIISVSSHRILPLFKSHILFIVSRTKRRAKKRNSANTICIRWNGCSIKSTFSMLVPGRYKWHLYLMETGTYIAIRCQVLGYCRERISNILTRFLKTQSTKEKERLLIQEKIAFSISIIFKLSYIIRRYD